MRINDRTCKKNIFSGSIKLCYGSFKGPLYKKGALIGEKHLGKDSLGQGVGIRGLPIQYLLSTRTDLRNQPLYKVPSHPQVGKPSTDINWHRVSVLSNLAEVSLGVAKRLLK